MIKPMLASNYDEKKLKFPLICQPKTDGVRGLNLEGTLTGRSLKTHANVFTTEKFSKTWFIGLDGEMFLGPRTNITSASLCRDTTSVLNSIKGEPDICWKVFDYIVDATVTMPYVKRLEHLADKVTFLDHPNILLVPSFRCNMLEELLYYDTKFLDEGYEGTIIRDPMGMYKEGRSTVREGGLLRIKRFSDAEAIVRSIVEGNTNNNEATVNELGRTERSTHQENMEPNGMVGFLWCAKMDTGELIKVSAGAMDHRERKLYFENQSALVGKVIKYKFFPKGVKDKPRFPTFLSLRAESDIQS